jgi:GntR family transcriptional regulator, transcriptional repressor for pyruvate dehydrogenase complex
MVHIVKANVTQQVFEYLRENIENGTWPIGSKIPSENELTKILSVSRSSIRMAIQQCIALDVLESQHGRGTFVKHNDVSGIIGTVNTLNETDYDDICEVLEFRKIIEKESACMAAQHAAPEHIVALEACLQKMKDSIGNADAFVYQDMLFHKEICKAAGNHILEFSLCNVFDKTVHSHKQINDLFGYKDGIYYHTMLLKAIQEKNPKKAKHFMKEHLQQAIDTLRTG